MAQKNLSRVRMAIVILFSACAILLFAACEGVSSSANGALTVSGKILSVNSSAGSVTVQGNVNGQQQTVTIGGLTAQELSTLQSHVNSNYAFQVTQNGNNYTLTTNTEPVSQDGATPENTTTSSTTPEATTDTNTNTGGNAQGNISLTAKIQSATNTSLVVLLPDGRPLTMSLTPNTDRHDFTGPFNQGQVLKVKAITNPDGSLQASELKNASTDQGDQNNDLNKVSFQGITTNTVGSDNLLHFKVGNQNYTASIINTTELKNLNNAQSIGNNQVVKVDVIFNGSTANAVKVEMAND